ISYRQLGDAMRLGKLGEQVVLMSEKAFGSIKYISNSPADASVYYKKKKERDLTARRQYRQTKHETLLTNELLAVSHASSADTVCVRSSRVLFSFYNRRMHLPGCLKYI